MHGIWRAFAWISLVAANVPALAQNASGCYFEVVSFPQKVDFASQIQPIFDARCSACHQPDSSDFDQHRLDLRAGRAFSALVDVPSVLDPSLDRVRSYRHLDSLLWSKVHCAQPQAGGPMPPAGHTLLTESEQRLIYGWIARGAPPSDLDEIGAVPIQPGMSGPWFDPSVQSQGFTFEIVERDPSTSEPSRLAALWFTFNIDPVSGDSEPGRQRWFLIDATYLPGESRADGPVLFFDSGLFDDFSSRARAAIGTASIVFRSCTEAYLSYGLNFDGKPALPRRSTITLRRITPAPFCIPDAGGAEDLVEP